MVSGRGRGYRSPKTTWRIFFISPYPSFRYYGEDIGEGYIQKGDSTRGAIGMCSCTIGAITRAVRSAREVLTIDAW